jgi:hypothetical protein
MKPNETVAETANIPPTPVATKKKAETVAGTANIPQRPGCLPEGYDENSLLTLPQFAMWKQISLKTVRKRLPFTPGLIRHNRKDLRVHVKTHLVKALKLT